MYIITLNEINYLENCSRLLQSAANKPCDNIDVCPW